MRLATVMVSVLAVSVAEGYITTINPSTRSKSELAAVTTVPTRWYRRRSNSNNDTIEKRRRKEPASIDLQGFTTQPTVATRPRTSLIHKLTCHGVASIVSRFISRGAKRGEAKVQVHLHHGFRKLITSGVLHADASLLVPAHLHFNALRFSRGVLEASDIHLHVPTQRYLKPFTLTLKDVQLTSNDLMESPCIRHGLRRLLTRVLVSDFAVCRIDDIRIEEHALVLLGTVTTILGQRVPFQVASRLRADNGLLVLEDLNVNVSGIFVKTFPLLSLDMGANTYLQSVVLKEHAMHVCGSVTITPELTEVPSPGSDATWRFDVGRWLTQKGHFDKHME